MCLFQYTQCDNRAFYIVIDLNLQEKAEAVEQESNPSNPTAAPRGK